MVGAMRHPGVARPALAAAGALAASLVVVATTVAATSGAPPGSPALQRMGVEVGDLASGGSIRRQGYVRDSHFAAYYVREFKPGAALGRSRLAELESDVGVTASRVDAVRLVGRMASALRSKGSRAVFVRGVLQDAGWDQGSLRIAFAGIRRIAGGDAAFIAPLTLALPGRLRLALVIEVVRVERAVQVLSLLGSPNTPIVESEATHLVDLVAARMYAELVPASVGVPSISGTAEAGQTLTGDHGSWTNAPIAYALQWLRCSAAGASCVPIDGAVTTSYTLTAADVGSTIELSVVASNAVGPSVPAVSAASAVVTAAVGPPVPGRA
jgi:hypothetical protein